MNSPLLWCCSSLGNDKYWKWWNQSLKVDGEITIYTIISHCIMWWLCCSHGNEGIFYGYDGAYPAHKATTIIIISTNYHDWPPPPPWSKWWQRCGSRSQPTVVRALLENPSSSLFRSSSIIITISKIIIINLICNLSAFTTTFPNPNSLI